jgi:hypothetical protein
MPPIIATTASIPAKNRRLNVIASSGLTFPESDGFMATHRLPRAGPPDVEDRLREQRPKASGCRRGCRWMSWRSGC